MASPDIPYYTINGIKYIEEYPINWIEVQLCEKTGIKIGAEHCHNCTDNASINGIVLGVCMNCASAWMRTRGNGFNGPEEQYNF